MGGMLKTINLTWVEIQIIHNEGQSQLLMLFMLVVLRVYLLQLA